ncbi:hypothetical protein [Streptomyces sp. NPDC004728]|uniref:hypothetical protein n=1 Tax=Streptomyces sp. NPDC004728 TaxID=3154289 RepID=UPI0033A82371
MQARLLGQVLARIASDGTLFDALRAVLCLGNGPDSTVAFEVEADGEWTQKKLATVAAR